MTILNLTTKRSFKNKIYTFGTMWILDAKQTKAADLFTIENEPVTSIDLMERASMAFVNRFLAIFPSQKEVAVFCGPGNNGGDGLAIARLLTQRNYSVQVFITHKNNNFSSDFLSNKVRLEDTAVPMVALNDEISLLNIQQYIHQSATIIDAIFGSGLNKSVSGLFKKVIEQLNNLPNTVVAVDMPSGLHQDKYMEGKKIKADYTIAFQFPKLSFLLPENEQFVGKWFVEDIGLDTGFLTDTSIQHQVIDCAFLQQFIKQRKRCSHKGTYGHSLIVAGSYGKMGAAILCSKAALKSGSGLVTAHLPKCGLSIMQSSLPEAMVMADVLDYQIGDMMPTNSYAALAIGPGLGQDSATVQAVERYLKKNLATVIDADALNIIAKHSDLKQFIKGKILTPHPKEFERLFGASNNPYERLKLLHNVAQAYDCTIILKDAYTCIASPNQNSFWFNITGNNGMATAGSGDVLTGLVAGLLAQGYTAFEASVLGVYLHGLAGDLYIEKHAPHSLIASDLIDHFGQAFKILFGKT